MKFNELKREIGDISSKTLSRTLKHLAAQSIANRKVLDTSPVTVQYSLTPRGRELSDSLFEFRKWGNKWLIRDESGPNPSRQGESK